MGTTGHWSHPCSKTLVAWCYSGLQFADEIHVEVYYNRKQSHLTAKFKYWWIIDLDSLWLLRVWQQMLNHKLISSTRVQQFILIRQSYYNIYQDGGDNNCFVFHSCRVVCEDIRFGDGHFVNFVPVSDLSGGNKQRSMKCLINPECCFK